jgi:uncharacterized protein (DUF924 family)
MAQLNEPGGADAAIATVLEVWFGTLDEGVAAPDRRQRWFNATSAFDQEIAERFAPLVAAAAEGGLAGFRATPRSTLAYVLVTDQFPRQIFRGTARAFATDPQALAAARAAIRRGDDATLGLDERAFLYLPFEHAEDLAAQEESVRLFTALRDDASGARRALADDYLRYAIEHRDIVHRFGRFPHRNAALGRASTDAEIDYLRTASGFGQRVTR